VLFSGRYALEYRLELEETWSFRGIKKVNQGSLFMILQKDIKTHCGIFGSCASV